MSRIVTIAGSPSATAKSSAILGLAHRVLKRNAVCSHAITVRNLPPEALIHADTKHPAIQEAVGRVLGSRGLLIATPIYKASYSGVLKTFLDLLPQDALKGKVILPLATGGSLAHLLALEYALKPVLSALGATHILRGVFLTDSEIQFEHGGTLSLEEEVERRLNHSLAELIRETEPLPDPTAELEYVI